MAGEEVPGSARVIARLILTNSSGLPMPPVTSFSVSPTLRNYTITPQSKTHSEPLVGLIPSQFFLKIKAIFLKIRKVKLKVELRFAGASIDAHKPQFS